MWILSTSRINALGKEILSLSHYVLTFYHLANINYQKDNSNSILTPKLLPKKIIID